MLPETMKHPPEQTKSCLRPQGRWTYEDWLNFPDDGWKYEIIDGVLYMTPAPAPRHQEAVGSLFARMYMHAIEGHLGKVLQAPCDVRLPNQLVPVEPDIFFVKKESLSIIGDQVVEGVPDLIVEVLSPSNASYDRVKKFEIYQQAGVPEYWLVDYLATTVECFVLREGAYSLAGRYDMGDVVMSEQLAGFTILVDLIFHS